MAQWGAAPSKKMCCNYVFPVLPLRLWGLPCAARGRPREVTAMSSSERSSNGHKGSSAGSYDGASRYAPVSGSSNVKGDGSGRVKPALGRRAFDVWTDGRRPVWLGSAVGTSFEDACQALALASPYVGKDFDALRLTWRDESLVEGHYPVAAKLPCTTKGSGYGDGRYEV
jgi:hypothetical protein